MSFLLYRTFCSQPENILIEVSGATPQLKLIDLGSAVEMGESPASGRDVLPPAPAQLEFAPPECVLGRPPAPAWDAWAAGVFLYVFLTGVSILFNFGLTKCKHTTTKQHFDMIFCISSSHINYYHFLLTKVETIIIAFNLTMSEIFHSHLYYRNKSVDSGDVTQTVFHLVITIP